MIARVCLDALRTRKSRERDTDDDFLRMLACNGPAPATVGPLTLSTTEPELMREDRKLDTWPVYGRGSNVGCACSW
ncbi:MAG TPA: hypothetical protein VM925_12460 [Labilithrix sp.]|nr:hypothetical protein [Labilithrix sp.]